MIHSNENPKPAAYSLVITKEGDALILQILREFDGEKRRLGVFDGKIQAKLFLNQIGSGGAEAVCGKLWEEHPYSIEREASVATVRP